MSFINFANPAGFWWVLLVLPIIGMYFLRVRLRRAPTTTLLFWNQLFDEKKPRSWWQRLRHWLSLALQLALIGLLISALVDPLWQWQKNQQRRIVLILDNSASMQARVSAVASRLDEAKQSARSLVRSLRDGDQMAIVTTGGQPRVIWGMTDHQSWLLRAIDELRANDAPAKATEAIELAKRLLSSFKDYQGEVLLLTDGCNSEVTKFVDDPAVKMYGVGRKLDNLAITRFQVRRSLVDAIGYQVLVDVTNFSDSERECRLDLELEGDLVDVIPIKLGPNETATRIVDHTSAAGGRMTAKLDQVDALLVDNSAVAILPTCTNLPITLVSTGNLFLESVLRSIPLVELKVVKELPSDYRAAVVVFDRVVPQTLPAGRVVVIDPQTDCELWKVEGAVDEPIVAKVDKNSGLTQHLRLDNVLFPGARKLAFESTAEKLIQDPLDIPLLARIPRSSGDVIVLTCSLDKGDLPLRIAFPVLMKNVVEWFQGNTNELRPSVSSGELVTLRVDGLAAELHAAKSNPADSTSAESKTSEKPSGSDPSATIAEGVANNNASAKIGEFELVEPNGEVTPIASRNGQVDVGPLLSSGVWLVRARPLATESLGSAVEGNSQVGQTNEQAEQLSAPGTLGLAVNLTDSDESDLRPRVELTQVNATGLTLLGGRSMWFYFTLLAAALLAIEWWLYQRRVVG